MIADRMRWVGVAMLAGSLLLAGSAVAQSPVNDGFARGDLASYVSQQGKLKSQQVSLVRREGMEGKQALRIAGDGVAQMIDLPIEPDGRYVLSMRCAFDGGESLEENPYLDFFLQRGKRTKVIPQRELVFLDAQGKRLDSESVGMPFRQWHRYRDEFHAPSKAAKLRLSFHSGKPGLALFVDDVRLEPAGSDQSLNINPVIAQGGLDDYSAWESVAPGGKFITMEDGRVVFDTKYGSTGKSFPVSEPGEYVVTSSAINAGYSPALFLAFFDSQGKAIHTIRLGPGNRSMKFPLPQGTVRARFSSRSLLIEEMRLVPVKK